MRLSDRYRFFSKETLASELLNTKDYSILKKCSKRKAKNVRKLLNDFFAQQSNILNEMPNYNGNRNFQEILDEAFKVRDYFKTKASIIANFAQLGGELPIVCDSSKQVAEYGVYCDEKLIGINQKDLITAIEASDFLERKEVIELMDGTISSAERVIDGDDIKSIQKHYLIEQLASLLRYRKEQIQAKEVDDAAIEEIEALEEQREAFITDTKKDPQYTLYIS